MLTLTVWEFNTAHGADEALEKVKKLHNEALLQLRRRGRELGVRAITPGTSALFALTSNEVYDKVAGEFRDTDAQLIRTNLSDEQETRLREAFDLTT